MRYLRIIGLLGFISFLSINASYDEVILEDYSVQEVVELLGGNKPDHFFETNPELVAMGKDLVEKGQTLKKGKLSKPISIYFTCKIAQIWSLYVLGNAQIAKYIDQKPEIKATIEKQHQNFQESYNSLLQTGTQIKNRLADSMAKFQEYEGALEAIMKNVETLEPQIKEKLDKPLEEVGDLQQEFDDFKVNRYVIFDLCLFQTLK